MNKKRPVASLAVLVAVLLAAFALRLFQLDAQSLWWDEGISLHLATSSPAQIVSDRAGNIHPPLYFFILKGWVSLVGVTPFVARYLSVLASLVQVTAVYAASRRWLGRSPAVWLAVLFSAVSPLAIIYAQETRVYAFLPLVYLALLVLVWPLAQAKSPPSRRLWWVIGLVEWAGLHLHYTTLFLIAFLNGWLLAVWLNRRRWLLLKRWLVTQTAVAAASLPWLIVVLMNRRALLDRVATARHLTEPVNWRFLLAQVGVFHLTGLPGALARPAVQVLASVVFAGLLLLWLWRMREASLRGKVLHLLAFWLIPLSAALVIWQFRSFSHPRYLVIFTMGLLILLAYVMAPGSERHGRSPIITGLSWVLGGSVLALSLIGLNLYFFDPGVAKDDMRGVARYLETATAPDDLILVQDAGWALEFEYNGRAPITMPDVANPAEMWRRLEQETARPRQIFTVLSATDSRDWQDVIPFALEQAGSLVAIQRFDGLVVRQYAITQPVAPPQMTDITANFGDLQLVGAHVEAGVAADTALTVAVAWRVIGTAVPRTYLDLRLLDVDNWPLVHKNDLLLNLSGQPADQWLPGQTITTYHILPIPPGTPPLTYALALSLSAADETGEQRSLDLLDAAGSPQGQQLRLAETLTLAPRTGLAANPYQVKRVLPRLPQPAVVAPGLMLIAAGLDRGQVGLGQSLFVSLEWEASQSLPDLRPRLFLLQSGVELAAADEAPAQGRYPTMLWSVGERVVEHRRLRVPAGAEEGTAVVAVQLGDVMVEIGEVEIVAEAHLRAMPPVSSPLSLQFGQAARLVGYDLPALTVSAVDAVPLTLYWEALADGGETSYTVFTHILADDGRLIGQHDGAPMNGTRSTTGWVAGEYVIDPHLMPFREPDYGGEATIEVGLYDPATGARLTTPEGQDHFILPVTLQVTPGE